MKDVVEAFPSAVVLGSKVCLSFLSNLIFTPFQQQVVKGGDQVDLGGGHVIEFVMAPNLHWPDTMFSYDHATATVFTCDAFGMHYCSEVRRSDGRTELQKPEDCSAALLSNERSVIQGQGS